MLHVLFSIRPAPPLEIAWRNPNPVVRHLRKHSFAGTGKCAMYLQQEFVTDGEVGHWTTISKLEVVVGGRAA
jgi:hypothetical protein